MSKSKRIAHYVYSTHWDREWYDTFQDFRFRLVNLIDHLLDTMKREPEFRYFQTDGQSILIEDYLEIRPKRENEIRELTKAGRIRIGPWYVAPDEFIVSGESLVRNLQIGIDVAKEYGHVSRVGFICDMFGHISQLPQIFRGFGIDSAFLSRGAIADTHGALWRWKSPDGSEVITYRFGHGMGYSSYANTVRKAIEPDKPFSIEEAMDDLSQLIEEEQEYCPSPSFLLFDGADHLEVEPETLELINRQNNSREDVEIVFSHLEAFVEDLREYRENITKVFTGELREPQKTRKDIPIITGVISSRMPLKQANAQCENELCLWAEPFCCFAESLGKPYPKEFLHLAWKYLLKNHPHDSICTCSIDQVHKDMEYRFDQSILISRGVTSDALRNIAIQAKHPELEKDDSTVVIFNSGADPIEEPVDITLSFPQDTDKTFFEAFGYEDKIGFRLYDSENNEIPYQLVNQRRDCVTFRRPIRKFPTKDVSIEVDISLPLNIPAYGYTSLVCRTIKDHTRYLGSMRVDDHTIENENLRVSVLPNGTISLTDKRNNQTYENLLTLEDCGDIGDGWFRGVPVNDQVFSSIAAHADVAVVADGLHKATLKIAVIMNVPKDFKFDSMVRNEETVPLKVTHFVTLRRGADHVEVKSEVENNVRDHRIRVLLPTGAKADTYFTDGAYDIVERPIGMAKDYEKYIELDTDTKPQYTWTAIHDPHETHRGLAIISTGMPESAACDLPDRPIALTLLRSSFKTVFTAGEDGGQIQGTHVLKYAITPLSDELPRTRLCRLGQQLAAPPRPVQLMLRDYNGVKSTMPETYSFVKTIPTQAVITAIHQNNNTQGTIVRMFNPHDEDIEETLELAQKVTSAQITDLEGNIVRELPVSNKQIKVTLKPKKIVTIRFT